MAMAEASFTAMQQTQQLIPRLPEAIASTKMQSGKLNELRCSPCFISKALSFPSISKRPLLPSRSRRFSSSKIAGNASDAHEADGRRTEVTFPPETVQSSTLKGRGTEVSDFDRQAAVQRSIVDTGSQVNTITDEPLSPQRRRRGRPKKIKEAGDFPDSEKQETMQRTAANSDDQTDSINKPRRGRPKKGIEQCSAIDARHPRGASVQEPQLLSKRREGIPNNPQVLNNVPISSAAKIEAGQDTQGFSLGEDINSSGDDSTDKDGDDDDYPLWVEEDDPNWLDEPDDGWGFRVSEFFKDPKIKNTKGGNDDDDSDDDEELDWDAEPDRWAAKEIVSVDWDATVFGDPSPLVVLLFERYGKRASESYQLLRELEDAANQIWDSHRLPPRIVKINASMEVDLASALKATEFPELLFIKAGKLLHRLTGLRTSDDLKRIIAYFYYGAGRPQCLKDVQAPRSVSNVV